MYSAEKWAIIEGFPTYAVSTFGRVRNLRTGRINTPFTDRLQEYPRVSLCRGGIKVKRMVHILVAGAFLGKKPNGYEIDHINTDKEDNLRYVTPEQNRNNPKTIENIRKAYERRITKKGRPSH